MFEALPLLGAGMVYQPALHDETLEHHLGIDYLEIPTDTMLADLPAWSARLDALKRNFLTVAHGIYMSLGDASGPHLDYLDRLLPYLEMLEPIWFSDHADLGNVVDDPIGMHFHGIEVPFTRGQAAVFRRNMRTFQQRVGLPLLAENIPHEFLIPMPGGLPEPLFLREALQEPECGLLLDVENLRINALNFRFDPYAWLEQAPLERTVEIHVAGGERQATGERAGQWIDTHSQPVPDADWRMVEYVVKRAPVKAITLERDQRYPPMEAIVAELDIARSILSSATQAPSVRSNADGRRSTPEQITG
jgi:uncharacterized protein (UPF0276 family)